MEFSTTCQPMAALFPQVSLTTPPIRGKYGFRNHFWPLESGFSHEQKWEKVRKRGLKQWNASYAILYVNTISKQLSDRIFVQKWQRNKRLSFLERLDWPNCSYNRFFRNYVKWGGKPLLAGENLFPGQKSEIAGEFPASVSQLLHNTSILVSQQ